MNNHKFSDLSIYVKPIGSCPLCHSRTIRSYLIIERYNPNFEVDRCKNCGFIFMNPRFNEQIINNLYKEDYYIGNAEYSYYDEREAERFAQYVWTKRIKIIRRFAKSGNLLDIGCAFGGFLKSASEYFTPYGIELSEYAGKHAKSIFGDNIHIGSLEDHPFKQGSLSVITMIELLEHLPYPAKAIRECFRLLRSDGLLLIQTANMDGLQARLLKERYACYMPGHLSYFTKNNLINLLRREGFERIKIFHPVEFGLLPKLLKSRYSFSSFIDYYKWLRIALYHYISKITFKNFSITSSMVVYAFKP